MLQRAIRVRSKEGVAKSEAEDGTPPMFLLFVVQKLATTMIPFLRMGYFRCRAFFQNDRCCSLTHMRITSIWNPTLVSTLLIV